MANVNPVNEIKSVLGGSAPSGLSEELTSIADVLRQLQAQQQAVMAQPATQPSGASSGASTVSSVVNVIEGVFGLGLGPLISGLVGLFGGGGGQSEPAPLVPYIAPPAVKVSAGISSSATGAFAVDTTQGGAPRAVPQITVQVQAMDSQSFLDHSNDIAMAVRQAMLESTTLNDVIREV
jgi:hypothetical protein